MMIKRINPDNKIFNNESFQKDKYKFFLILQNLGSETLELYSDEENYIICRGEKTKPTWIWTKDNIDLSLLKEIEEAIDLYRLDVDTRFTCKKELYDLLKNDNFKSLGDYYFEMGYLVCEKTIEPKKCDGKCLPVTEKDLDILADFIYNDTKEMGYGKEISIEHARELAEERLSTGNFYKWVNDDNKIVAHAFYRIVSGNVKIAGVYTLPEERGKGYAANLIYDLTNKVLKEGYHVSLYTDYKYIPSNKAYKNVGYEDKDILINFSCIKK